MRATAVLYRSFRDRTEQADWSTMITHGQVAEGILNALALSIYNVSR